MPTIAIEIKGELENQSPMCIGNEFYPRGQDIRGAMGYAFLDLGLKKVSRTFEKDAPHFAYFKDAYVRHNCRDKGRFLPVVQMMVGKERNFPDTIYKCDKCGTTLKYPTQKDKTIGIHINRDDRSDKIENANSFVLDTIGEGNRFDLDMILNVNKNLNKALNKNIDTDRTGTGTGIERIDIEDCVAEFISGVKYVSESGGFNLGKRSRKGLGLTRLKGIQIKKITMEDISRRGDIIYEKIKKDGSKITIHLLSDTIEKFPITGDDLLRNIKNAAKFFDPHWNEYSSDYKEPKIVGIGKPMDANTSITFLDLKIGDGVEKPEFGKADKAIARGTQFNYQLSGLEKIGSEFYNAIAFAELRGIGDRTSFGKGQFIVT